MTQKIGKNFSENDSTRIVTFRNHKTKQTLQILVSAKECQEYNSGKIKWNSNVIMASDEIYTSCSKGVLCSKNIWQSETSCNKKKDALKWIVDNGELHSTNSERQKERQSKSGRSQRLNDS